ncbi:MAG TPA: MFS transporter [Chloroflexota bacterium]|nr:MFS transporter [Chloroflexota bacterium]
MSSAPPSGLSRDFWKFFCGQLISTFGSSFTQFAIPLLVYKLTNSSVNLAISAVADFLPYLLFGLVMGAWADRADRKRLMIGADLILAVLVGSIPVLYAVHHLSLLWIYASGFLGTTTFIAFNSAEYAALPSLVSSADLVTANGRIDASYQAASILGPIIAGALAGIIAIPNLLAVDAVSYVLAAAGLLLVRGSFNLESGDGKSVATIRQDIVEGLRYVIGHPILRNISLMMAMVNFVGATLGYQLVLFASRHLHATKPELGLLFSANAAGFVVFGLLAGWFRRHWSFSVVALGALMVSGLLTVVFAVNPIYWLSLPLWAVIGGLGIMFNINTRSLRQAIVPNHLLGRVMSIAGVLAWSAIPAGTLIGGFAIKLTGNVVLVYAAIGVLTFLIPLGFAFSPLGHADRYLAEASPSELESVEA